MRYKTPARPSPTAPATSEAGTVDITKSAHCERSNASVNIGFGFVRLGDWSHPSNVVACSQSMLTAPNVTAVLAAAAPRIRKNPSHHHNRFNAVSGRVGTIFFQDGKNVARKSSSKSGMQSSMVR